MRIFIDIGHPAHVHYFKNFIKIMQNKGHKFFITARDKEVTHQLLNFYQIEYSSRGKGFNNLIGKLFYIFKADFLLLKLAIKFKPDIFLSFFSPYATHVSKILNKPNILFNDTEHSKFVLKMYFLFSTDVILSPSCCNINLGKNHFYFESYMELSYLHENYFKPDIEIKNKLNIRKNEKYVILRFISWNANHDIGQKGLMKDTKEKIIDLLKDDFKIFISSEGELPAEFEKYRLRTKASDLHSVLASASLYIGEGSTTASECSVLGIPNIYINSISVGYCSEQEKKYGLCLHLINDENLIEKIKDLINNKNLLDEWKTKRNKMIKEKIDATAFMVWFVEKFPKSVNLLREYPLFQYKFRYNGNIINYNNIENGKLNYSV